MIYVLVVVGRSTSIAMGRFELGTLLKLAYYKTYKNKKKPSAGTPEA